MHLRKQLSPRWTDRFAWLLSVVLSPMLVGPFFCYYFAQRFAENPYQLWLWLAICVLGTTLVPAGYIAYQVKKGAITDLHVRELKQRRGPFVAGMIGLGLCTFLLVTVGADIALIKMSWSTMLTAFIYAAVSERWKISVHTGVLTLCLAGAYQYLGWSAARMAMAPLLCWARVKRGRHTPLQAFSGVVAGILAVSFTAMAKTL